MYSFLLNINLGVDCLGHRFGICSALLDDASFTVFQSYYTKD